MSLNDDFFEVLTNTGNSTVSILVHGSFKPYTGKVKRAYEHFVELVNDYSSNYVYYKDIIAIRVYDR